jgi:DNA-binding transcriptional MerR regulator
MAETTPRPAKRYYSIREVSELLDEKPHVLRYWETQFPLLRPRKNRAGNRMYQERDLDLLRSIQEMLHVRGYTIAGARTHIAADHRRRESERRAQMDIDFLAPSDRRKLREIRSELLELRAWLAGTDRSPRWVSTERRAGERGPDGPEESGRPETGMERLPGEDMRDEEIANGLLPVDDAEPAEASDEIRKD